MGAGKVLIVDDNPNMSTLLSEILEIFDCKGHYADDGNQALNMLEEDKYDMVFTDVRMPNMDGFELLESIKTLHPDVPVVIITGYSVADSQSRLLSEKADGFLSKPFKVDEIQSLLATLLKH